MPINKITWAEFYEALREDHSKKGVVVIKQHPNWEREFSLGERSYRVDGNAKFFDDSMAGMSIFAFALEGADSEGIRLDYCLRDPDPKTRWEVEYCYFTD